MQEAGWTAGFKPQEKQSISELPELTLAARRIDGSHHEEGDRDSARLPQNLIKVPLMLQSTDYTCGCAALQSVLKYYGDETAEMDLARELKTTHKDGTNHKEIENYAKKHGYDVSTHVNASLDELKQAIDQGKPALVLIQAWAEKTVDYKNDWDDGHYVVATGYDERNIYFMDPSTMGNYAHIPISEFMDRWHDVDAKEKLHHFFMTVSKPKPAYNPVDVPKISLLPQSHSHQFQPHGSAVMIC